MQRLIRSQRDASWTYITQVKHDVRVAEDRFQPLILFGVVLVAVTILGVMAAVLINADPATAPTWVRQGGWIVLVATFAAGGLATAVIVVAEAWHRGAQALQETMKVVRQLRRR